MTIRVAVVLAVAFAVSIAGCGKQPAPSDGNATASSPSASAPLAAAKSETPVAVALTAPPSAVSPVAPVGDGPRIEFSTTDLDMGTVSNAEPSKGTVMIRNRGNAPLVLSQVNTSCGCAMGSIAESDKLVQPGGEVPLTVMVTPSKIHGFESTKMLTVFSNDQKHPRMELRVKVKIEPEFILDPPLLAFEKVQKGEVARKQVVVRQAMDEPFKEAPFEVKGAQALGAPPGLTATLSPRPETEWAAPGRREYVVDVALDTNEVPPGPYQAMLSLETSVTRIPRVNLSVTADVVAPYRVTPRPASFGLAKAGQSPAGTVTVSADQAVAVSNVEISGTELKAAVAPGPDEKTKLIQISVNEDASGGPKREQLSFTVKSGEIEFREHIQVVLVVAPATPPPSN
ncbi:MAG: DUF1573 domain-containing protein [FCB group bacterium]|jgi:hypothetical protein|nr:DUF1573 domain-containing protein [FCB group bacterium]